MTRNDLTNIILWIGLAAQIAMFLRVSWIDYHQHRIPNRLVAPQTVGTCIWVILLGATSDDLGSAATSLLIGVAVAAIALTISLATAGIGMGDVKLIAPLTVTLAWLGRNPGVIALLACCAAALLASGLSLATGNGLSHRIALAPILTIGLIAGTIALGLVQ